MTVGGIGKARPGFRRKFKIGLALSLPFIVSACAAPSPDTSVAVSAANSPPQSMAALEQLYGSTISEDVFNPTTSSTDQTAVQESPPAAYALADFSATNKVISSNTSNGGGVDPLALGVMNMSPGSPWLAPLAVLDVLGNFSSDKSYGVAPNTFGTIPFLSFYRILPPGNTSTTNRAAILSQLEIALQLEAASHEAIRESQNDMILSGKFMTRNMDSQAVSVGSVPVSGILPKIGDSNDIIISWSARLQFAPSMSGPADMEVGAFSLPQSGTYSVPGAGVLVFVNTSRPISGTFVTPSSLDGLLASYPLPADWYAVYNTPVNGKVEIAVFHGGQTTYFALPKS